MDIHKMLLEGAAFKKSKDEVAMGNKKRRTKPKGKTISGAAKMRAAYKAKKNK